MPSQPIHVRVVAEELRRRPAPRPPEGLGRTGAAAGAAAGFGGSLFYIMCAVLFGLTVTGSGTADASLLPQTARWVSDLLAFTVYGGVSSVLFGAALGALNGSIQRRMWSSRSPLLAWVLGMLLNFIVVLAVHVILIDRGFSTHLAIQLRYVTIPGMIFVLEGGLVGLWVYLRAERADRSSDQPAA